AVVIVQARRSLPVPRRAGHQASRRLSEVTSSFGVAAHHSSGEAPDPAYPARWSGMHALLGPLCFIASPGQSPAQAIVDGNDMSARTPAILSVCMRPLLFEDEPSGTPATRRNGTHLGMRRTAQRCSHTGVRQGEDGDSFVSAAASTRAQ